MADTADIADIQNTKALEADIKYRRRPDGPKATGKCLYCNCALTPGVRWCDKGCQEDWETEQAAKSRECRRG